MTENFESETNTNTDKKTIPPLPDQSAVDDLLTQAFTINNDEFVARDIPLTVGGTGEDAYKINDPLWTLSTDIAWTIRLADHHSLSGDNHATEVRTSMLSSLDSKPRYKTYVMYLLATNSLNRQKELQLNPKSLSKQIRTEFITSFVGLINRIHNNNHPEDIQLLRSIISRINWNPSEAECLISEDEIQKINQITKKVQEDNEIIRKLLNPKETNKEADTEEVNRTEQEFNDFFGINQDQ